MHDVMSRKRKEHPGALHDIVDQAHSFATARLGPTPSSNPFQPGLPSAPPACPTAFQATHLEGVMGGRFLLPPHLRVGAPERKAFPNPVAQPGYVPENFCCPGRLHEAFQAPLGSCHMFQPNGEPTPEEQRRLHEDVQAHLRAGQELLQALQCPPEMPVLGLTDLTNQANAAVSLSAGLPQSFGCHAARPHHLEMGPMRHSGLSPSLLCGRGSVASDDGHVQARRPDLTAAIKGLGTASLGATLLLKAALQKQQAAPL